MGLCYLVGAGAFCARDFAPEAGDFVIAADAGYDVLRAMNITPDLLVGDFDSLAHRPAGVPTHTHPVEKDDTDMALAFEEGFALGYRDFAMYGADGGRLDHTLANLQLLGGASRRGANVRMVGNGFDMVTLTNGTLTLPERAAGTLVSVFCHGAVAEGVTLRGLRYPLLGATLTADRALGVSNEYRDTVASITVENGTLLVYIACPA